MPTLIAWTAKRTVLARILNTVMAAAPADPLYEVQVEYALPANPERVCVYGGRVRSTRAQAGGEHALLFREDVTVEIRVRVNELGGDIGDTEMTMAAIAQAIAVAVSQEPRLVPEGAVAVTATDQDATIVSSAPEPYVTVTGILMVTLSMITGGS